VIKFEAPMVVWVKWRMGNGDTA